MGELNAAHDEKACRRLYAQVIMVVANQQVLLAGKVQGCASRITHIHGGLSHDAAAA